MGTLGRLPPYSRVDRLNDDHACSWGALLLLALALLIIGHAVLSGQSTVITPYRDTFDILALVTCFTCEEGRGGGGLVRKGRT